MQMIYIHCFGAKIFLHLKDSLKTWLDFFACAKNVLKIMGVEGGSSKLLLQDYSKKQLREQN